MTKKKIAAVFWLIITIIPIMGVVVSLINPKEFDGMQRLAQAWIMPLGLWGPLAFILLQILQVIITPISHYSVSVVGGYLYGPYLGGFYNYIGRMIGHVAAFMIARRFGRHLLEKYVDSKTIEKYDYIMSGVKSDGTSTKLHTFILFLIYFLPLFPDDEISYMVGASRMSRRNFLLANLFGQLGGSFGLAYIGAGIDKKDFFFWFLLVSTLLGFLIFWIMAKKNKISDL